MLRYLALDDITLWRCQDMQKHMQIQLHAHFHAYVLADDVPAYVPTHDTSTHTQAHDMYALIHTPHM